MSSSPVPEEANSMRELRTGALGLGLEFPSIIHWLVYLGGHLNFVFQFLISKMGMVSTAEM